MKIIKSLILILFFFSAIKPSQKEEVEWKLFKRIEDGENENEKQIKNMIYCVAFSHDSNYIASGNTSGIIKIWNVHDGKCEKKITGHKGVVAALCFSKNNKHLVSGSFDGTIKIWDLTSDNCDCIQTIINNNHVRSVEYHNNDKNLISSSVDNNIMIWKSHDENYIVNAYTQAYIPILDLRKLIACYIGWELEHVHVLDQKDFVNGITCSSDNKNLASSDSKYIKIWDLLNHKEICSLNANSAKCLAYSPCNNFLATTSGESKGADINVINLASLAIKNLTGHRLAITSISYSNDGNFLVSASQDTTVKIWNLATNKCIQTLNGHRYIVKTAIISPNDQVLASIFTNNILIWNKE